MGFSGVKTAIAGIFTFEAMFATAQNLSFGADNFYRSDNVTLWPITFPTQFHTTIAANLFLPNDLDRSVNTSAIIVGHPQGAVKEQASNLYAQKMAEQGFVTIAVDMPYWGGSEGQPRNTVAPDEYAEAFSAAVDYLGTLDYINRDGIGGIGICGSGSYLISAAKIDSRIAAVATSTMYDMGAASRNGLQHSQDLDARRQAIATASQQRWVEAQGGETLYTGGTPDNLTSETNAVGREFYDFYRTSRAIVTPPGSMPNLTTHPTLASNTRFMNYYPLNDLDLISPRPILIVHGDQAHSLEFGEDAYNRASEPKELYLVPGAGHVDLYDRTELIPFAKFVDFFQTNLNGN